MKLRYKVEKKGNNKIQMKEKYFRRGNHMMNCIEPGSIQRENVIKMAYVKKRMYWFT